jgi:hypothetical protein
MRAAMFAALLLLGGCRIDLDHAPEPQDAAVVGRNCSIATSTACMNADTHSDFTFIKNTIFPLSCSASDSCHKTSTSSGKLDLSPTGAYASLLGPNGTGGVMADVDKSRVLVVPGMPKQSYFFFMIHGVLAADGDPPFSAPPSNIGLMPENNGNKAICCQKLDAIERWITAGAKND